MCCGQGCSWGKGGLSSPLYPPPQLIPAPMPTPGCEETGALPVPARRSPACLRRKAAGRPARAASPPAARAAPAGLSPARPAATQRAPLPRRDAPNGGGRLPPFPEPPPGGAAAARTASAGRPAAPRPGCLPPPARRRATAPSRSLRPDGQPGDALRWRGRTARSRWGARSGAGIGARRGVWAGRLGATSEKVWGLEAAALTLPPEGAAVRPQLSAASRSEPAAAPAKAPASGRLCPAAPGAEEGLEGAKIAEAAGRKAEEPVTWAPTPRRDEGRDF